MNQEKFDQLFELQVEIKKTKQTLIDLDNVLGQGVGQVGLIMTNPHAQFQNSYKCEIPLERMLPIIGFYRVELQNKIESLQAEFDQL